MAELMKTRLYIGCALIALTVNGGAYATETIDYKYDAKGRLIEVRRAGTVNNNVTTAYQHDKADNRKVVTTAGSANGTPSPPPPSPPPPPPPSSNNPPIANPDNGGSMKLCAIKTVIVTANDTDPNGDPIAVISAVASGDMTATVVSATSVQIESNLTPGTKSIFYTISDGRGGSASSTVSVTVSGGVCN